MVFNREADFEEALISALQKKGWGDVLLIFLHSVSRHEFRGLEKIYQH